MKYLRRTPVYTLLNHKRNEETLEELHVTALEEKRCTYRHNLFQSGHRMEDYRHHKQLLNCIQKEDDDLDDHVIDY
jgi:hypothetical protein